MSPFKKVLVDLAYELGAQGIKHLSNYVADAVIPTKEMNDNIYHEEDFIEQEENGDATAFEESWKYLKTFASVLGQFASADGVVKQQEKEFFEEGLIKMIFEGDDDDEPLITPEDLASFNVDRKELEEDLYYTFEIPMKLKSIVNYAEEYELENLFYEMAYAISLADEVIQPQEAAYLEIFAMELGLTAFEKQKTEKKWIKIFEEEKEKE